MDSDSSSRSLGESDTSAPWRPRYRWRVLRWERGEWCRLVGDWKWEKDVEEFTQVMVRPMLAWEPDPEERQLRIIRTIVFRAREPRRGQRGWACSPSVRALDQLREGN